MHSYKMVTNNDDNSIWMVKSQDKVGDAQDEDKQCLPSAIDLASEHQMTGLLADPVEDQDQSATEPVSLLIDGLE